MFNNGNIFGSSFSILGVYYFSGILTYLFIYTKNSDKNRVYLNATRLMFNECETDLDSIIEDDPSSPDGWNIRSRFII